jgi:hypothetical protein
VVIPKHHWFAAEIIQGDFILVGCTVSPGFEFEDFELADRSALAMFLGIIIVYSALFATGMFIYGNISTALILTSITLVAVVLLIRTWKKLTF